MKQDEAIVSAGPRPYVSKKPLILDYYLFTEEHEPYLVNSLSKLQLRCRLCNREIAASIKITSNWITHLKAVHRPEYMEFIKLRPPKMKFDRATMMMTPQQYQAHASGQHLNNNTNNNSNHTFSQLTNGNAAYADEDGVEFLDEADTEYNMNNSNEDSHWDGNGEVEAANNWFIDEQTGESMKKSYFKRELTFSVGNLYNKLFFTSIIQSSEKEGPGFWAC